MRLVSVLVTCACVLLLPPTLAAQSAMAPDAPESKPEREASRHPSRLYLGMWTTHVKRDPAVLENNWVIGITHRGFFGATFQNSFGRRAFTGGIQRTIVAAGSGPLGASFGYRLGFVTGYDERFMRLARKTPVLPLIQPFVSFDVQRVGLEVSYTFVVASVAVSYKF